jgi:diguanylate cyclase (GGDEF)-like protein/PAS domain S-box-containing protein
MKPLLDTARTLLIAQHARREQQRLEQDLRATADERRKLAEVATLSSNAVVVADAGGRVEWINDAFTRMTGYTLDDLRGRKPGEALQGPGTDAATVREIGGRLRRGEGTHGVEILNYHKSGRPYWALLEIQPVRDDEGRVVRYVSTESDVTELRAARERAEATARELARTNALFAAAGRIARLGSWQLDAATGAAVWSDITYDIHEVERGVPMDLALTLRFYAPADRAVVERAVGSAVAAAEPWDIELQLVTAYGRRVWVRSIGEPVVEDGKVTALRGVLQDIDAQRRAAEALREEQARAAAATRQLRVAFESLEDGFVLFDADDRLALCNEKYRQIYAASADRIAVGVPFEDMIRGGVARGQYPDAQGREEEWIEERLAAHRRADSVIEQRLPDGRWMRIAERRTADGGIVGFRVDVTALKDATARAEAAAAEAARLSSEMNAIFELSPDGFVAFDAGGHLTYSNPAFHQMTGLEAARVRNMSLADFDRELAQRCDPAEFYVTSDQVADGALVRLALTRPRAMTLQRAVRTLRDADGDLMGLVIYLRDVTEALTAERALVAQQAKFAAAFRHSGDFIAIVRSLDDCFVDVNDAFERMTGYTRGEAIGRNAAELRLWVDEELRAAALRELRDSGAVHDVQSRLRRRDGTVRHVVASAAQIDIGAELGVMWTVRDVTEQLAAVDALRASEARFAAAFRSAADDMVISRLEDGRIVEVNDAFCRAMGRARDEVLGRTALELGVWADPAARAEAMRQLVATGMLANYPFLQRRGDGTVTHCLLSASVVVIDGVRCVLKTARDISERVAAEESARQLTARLQASVAALEEVNRHNALLSEMRDLLQTCHTPAEVRQVAAHFVPKLLAGSRGALYLINENRSALEAAFAWHDDELREAVFGPEACWGLRRGRPYHVEAAGDALVCGHVAAAPSGGYLCLPMAAQGETYGVLHVRYDGAPEGDPMRRENRENFLRTMTEHVALAMSNARLRENLRMQASRDALTGLVNRHFMEEAFEREISRCRRRDRPVAVLMIDIDHFKSFNDRHGHEAGDQVLKLVAATLAKSVRFEDIVCRFGGEEFLVILPEADQAIAFDRAEQARSRVAELVPYFRDTPLGTITISVGLAMFPRHGALPDEVVRHADAALFEAKRSGRNRVVVAGSETD